MRPPFLISRSDLEPVAPFASPVAVIASPVANYVSTSAAPVAAIVSLNGPPFASTGADVREPLHLRVPI